MNANGADALRKLRAKLDKHCAVSEDAMMVVIIDDEMQDMRNLLDAYLADPAKDALVKALKRMLDAFHEDPFENNTSGAVEEAYEALEKAGVK